MTVALGGLGPTGPGNLARLLSLDVGLSGRVQFGSGDIEWAVGYIAHCRV